MAAGTTVQISRINKPIKKEKVKGTQVDMLYPKQTLLL